MPKVNLIDLPKKDITRPHKFKMESDSSAVLKKKFKKDMEVLDYYQDVVKQKKENHDRSSVSSLYPQTTLLPHLPVFLSIGRNYFFSALYTHLEKKQESMCP